MTHAAAPRPERPPIGELLRVWRRTRGKSQLALALDAGVSARHLSFIESGRAGASREMVLKLASALDVPLRERNDLLLAAGYAPIYRESLLADDEMAPVRRAFESILAKHEPWPAVLLDRSWNLLRTNGAAEQFFARFAGDETAATDERPPNVIRMMFDPAALRPYVLEWETVARALLARVHREAVGGVLDEQTRDLLDEVLAYPGVPRSWAEPPVRAPLPVIPVSFAQNGRTFRFFSTVTTIGTPQDVTSQEIRIECFFPIDGETEQNLAPPARRSSAAALFSSGSARP